MTQTQKPVQSEEVKKTAAKPKKEVKKSKVGSFYTKWKLLESSRDSDQVTTFDLKGDRKKLGQISLPDSTAKILNRSTKWSGIYYEKV